MRPFEIIKSKNKNKQKNERKVESESYDIIKWTITCVMEVPEKEEWERSTENTWRNDGRKPSKFYYTHSHTNTQIQETQQTLIRTRTNGLILWHIIIKLSKVKDKENILQWKGNSDLLCAKDPQ